MLSVKNLVTRTGHKISAEVKNGTFAVLMGVNGVGKSTLLATIAGSLTALEGKIFIDERDISKMTSIDRARKIALLSTERGETMSLSVRETVSLGRVPHTGWSGHLESVDEKIVDGAIANFKLEELQNRNAARLSDGEKQRVSLARVVAQTADVILLDEPLSHLDIPWRSYVMNLLRGLAGTGKIIIASSHEYEHARQSADEIWMLHEEEGQKKFLRGSPEELRRNGIFEKVFGVSRL